MKKLTFTSNVIIEAKETPNGDIFGGIRTKKYGTIGIYAKKNSELSIKQQIENSIRELKMDGIEESGIGLLATMIINLVKN